MEMEKPYPTCKAQSIEEWRQWLAENHRKEEVIWLVFKKKGKDKGAPEPPFNYQMALDEALCYGWVDSLLKSIDEACYMRKFTPRKASSTWSELNKKHVQRLQAEGRMQAAGLKTVEVAKQNGQWDKGITPPEVNRALPGALLHAFAGRPRARDAYFALALKKQEAFNTWINMAKRPETIRRRVLEALEKLERGEELGLK
jgi:uncharacterized protein YdeI (YjbR/CyaY-like superfamily)